jgi:hypothetical protein
LKIDNDKATAAAVTIFIRRQLGVPP